MSNGKSGFEIRADLLNQAQGLLEQNINREVDAVYMHNDNNPNNKRDYPLKLISAEEVISVAKQLNEFVNDK
jgi:hypothetical protein|tara:strand:+ start:747 stop:962 length:216 start_codon:yes stop_codon:yes gene_type:complete